MDIALDNMQGIWNDDLLHILEGSPAQAQLLQENDHYLSNSDQEVLHVDKKYKSHLLSKSSLADAMLGPGRHRSFI